MGGIRVTDDDDGEKAWRMIPWVSKRLVLVIFINDRRHDFALVGVIYLSWWLYQMH
jgi:hypothetical protein